MRTNCLFLAFLVALASLVFLSVTRAAEPIIVELPEQVAVRASLVTVGDVARVSGGDATTRQRIARLDLAEFKARDQSLNVSRRQVEFRLQLADIDLAGVQVIGAERSIATVTRRSVTPEEVLTAVRKEFLLRFVSPPENLTVELLQPIVVKLPEIPAADLVTITAQPHGRAPGIGHVQMDATIMLGGERLLSLAVWLDAKVAARPGEPITRLGGVLPSGPVQPAAAIQPQGTSDVLVRSRQRVTMQVRSGVLNVTALGEAQQEGRLGQSILVQNVDSKKIVTGRVSGPGVVDLELGGGP